MCRTSKMDIIKLISVFLFVVAATATEVPIVEISNGKLQGTLSKSYNGRAFSSFEGIPFAKPPIGERRFESPEEPYDWTGVWIANTEHWCLQYVFNTGKMDYSRVTFWITQTEFLGSEDCLYINVHVPRTTPNSADNLNVIVHIHGGAFMFGSGHHYAGPKYLMDEEVVFVTVNYRLGPFGFLSTGDDVVPGNNGMKDQVLALKWIQKNIKYFGGNPQSVTITGMSAGAASVHLHYFSPLSKELFHRGVSQSGSALNPWVIQETVPERSKHLGELVGCSTETSDKLVKCLKSRSGDQIVTAIENLYAFDGFPAVLFGPVIEKQEDGAFLNRDPYKMLVEKSVLDVPWIVSITSEEGEFIAYVFSKNISKIFKSFNDLAPQVLEFNENIFDKDFIIEKIKKHYFKKPEDVQGIIRLFSDRYFNHGADRSAKLQAKANKSPVYFYILDYRGKSSFADYFMSDTNHMGCSHGDDIFYYLHTPVAKEILSPLDQQMKSIFLEWLTNYANNQQLKMDQVVWDPVTDGESLKCLRIKDPNKIYMDLVHNLGVNSFWRQLDVDGYHQNVQRNEL